MTQDMEERINLLYDIEAIKELKALFCYLADARIAGDSSKAEELLSLCTDDIRLEFAHRGTFEGKEALKSYLEEPSRYSYTSHTVSNPIIKVAGNRASGRWYVNLSLTLRDENRAAWGKGKYEDEYVKVNGEWLFKAIKASIEYITPFDEGWAKTRMI